MTRPSDANLQPKRILFSLLGDRKKASSRVRGYWIGDELEKLGHAVSYSTPSRRMDFLSLVLDARRSDVVVFQKTYSRYAIMAQKLIRLMGKAIFFDIDDAPARQTQSVSFRNAKIMMQRSDGVLAGSENLAKLALDAGAKVHFVPSGIRLENYQPSDARVHPDQICLGWIGNGAQYAADLVEILEAPLRILANRHPIKFKIVGACDRPELSQGFGAIEGLELELVNQLDWSDAKAVSDAVADFDIGLYPLLSNDFNIYKCAFKALEYMANSIPVVASDVGANGDVVEHGINGFLPQTEADWITYLDTLIADAPLRTQMGSAGRAKIEAHFSTKAIAKKISEIL